MVHHQVSQRLSVYSVDDVGGDGGMSYWWECSTRVTMHEALLLWMELVLLDTA